MLCPRPDDILYHYTDAAGIIGILKTAELWATNILHFNDASEFKHRSRLAVTYLKSSAHTWDGEPLTQLLTNPETIIRHSDELPFVVSFSKHGDQLSQWRAYCGKGDGFSIGFRYSHLKYLRQQVGFRVLKCVYEEDGKQSLIHRTARFHERIERRANRIWKTDAKDPFRGLGLTVRFYSRASLYLVSLKHHGFVEEQEWRLAGLKADHVPTDYRTGRFASCPTVDCPYAPQAQPSNSTTFTSVQMLNHKSLRGLYFHF